ncbi:MAG: hypothetical protein KA369_15795 [Spirochaetes bacterium]|nr:hypothetical protein [Spirochaetota bacterium]
MKVRRDGSADMEEFRRLLGKASPTDFDGHTDFDRLTPEQRLLWLSQCAEFFTEAKPPNR